MPSPRHHIDARVHGLPASPVPLRKLRGGLATWIAALPEGTLARRAAPFRFAHDGMVLQFHTLAQRRRPPSGPGRLSSTSYGIEMKAPGRDLRSRIMGKANRYGELDLPYVVAIANSDPAGGERDVLDALVGSPVAVVSPDADGSVSGRAARAPDGVWTEGGRPRKRGLSAILSFDRISAWRPSARGARLVRNPWAVRPLPDIRLPVDELTPDAGEFRRRDRPDRADWFELGARWPESEEPE